MNSRKIKLVYVAGKYTAPTPHEREINIQEAWRAGIDVARVGACPVVPHMSSAHLDAIQDYEFWIAATLRMLEVCDAVLMIPGWQNSRGACGERDAALALGKPVFYSFDELEGWVVGEAAE